MQIGILRAQSLEILGFPVESGLGGCGIVAGGTELGLERRKLVGTACISGSTVLLYKYKASSH